MTVPAPPVPTDFDPRSARPKESSRYAWILALLLAMFAFRVGAQVIQLVWPFEAIPPYDAWHSGLLPYPLLLTLQVLILAGGGFITARVACRRVQPSETAGSLLLSFGAIYFAMMLFRFGVGVITAAEGPFVGKSIPAFFHLVLSAWLMTLGLFHVRSAQATNGNVTPKLVHWLAYPVLISACLLLHVVLLDSGLNLPLSTYVPVAVGAASIALLERRLPHREEWHPGHADVASDITFMVFVQILLPKVLAFLVAVAALRFLQDRGIALRGLWPHHLPPFAQALLMLLLADFLRYWLHRASHEWSPLLWRFHAVHHSPPKLYWANVGRFHPVEKSLQFLCDAAPFILVGVPEQVLAIYFVFYAVNGFFQHCNVEVRLGVLNFLISGPELHRWHHSRDVRESNKNYGNNVIVWDLLFGSFFLPKGQTVQELGLRNRAYPLDFFRQMRTPFIKGLDQEQDE